MFDRHEHFEERFGTRFRSSPILASALRNIFLRVEQFLLRRTHAVIVVSPDMARQMQKMLRRRVYVVENRASSATFGSSPRDRESLEETQIVHTGTLSKDRGSLDLIRLAGELDSREDHLREVIVAVFTRFLADSDREEFFNYLREFGHPSNLRLLEPVPLDVMAEGLEEATFGLSLLYPVGQYPRSTPTKLHEYLAAGVVPIAYDLPATRSLIAEAGAGAVVDVGNVQGLVGAVAAYLADRRRLSNESACARRYFQSAGAWEANASMALLAAFDGIEQG